MKATLVYRDKIISEDTICEMVIWRLPGKSKERPHSIKYRLHFGKRNGKCLVRYDNEQGKGDHRHYGELEEVYIFSTVEKLVEDFLRDIGSIMEKMR